MAALQLYNTLSRKKDVFTPLDPAHVRLYACGPTVYNYAHIGNARMAVVFDLLVRLLRTLYPKVTYVSNITDVDDKIIAAARESGASIDEITKKYARIYNEDMKALGVAAPDIQPLATTHITHMIALIEALMEKGHAYAADGHVLFHVPSFPAYGGLSGRSRDEQIAGARVEIASYKKDPADFVLWKPSSGDEPGWDSPWGYGRPGWHIECSAMAQTHLGLPFDIHGGGADLKFPHHENEIAQSCCASGAEEDLSAFAKMWVHNGFVTVEGEKMSKSLGNVVLVHDEIAQHKASYGQVIRLALLSAHYRKPLDWNAQILHQAEKLYEKIGRALEVLKSVPADETVKDVHPDVMAALCDDLNTPLAFMKLGDVLGEIRKAEDAAQPVLKATLLNTLSLLGITPEDSFVQEAGSSSDDSWIEALLSERRQAKADRNFARADEIRDKLAAKGITIEDTPSGPVWRRI